MKKILIALLAVCLILGTVTAFAASKPTVAFTAKSGNVNGSFDYDISDGKIIFKLTQCFRDSLIGDGCLQYLLGLGCHMVDQYNDRFLALSKGIMSLSDFLKKENE